MSNMKLILPGEIRYNSNQDLKHCRSKRIRIKFSFGPDFVRSFLIETYGISSKEAIYGELESILANETGNLVDFLKGSKYRL